MPQLFSRMDEISWLTPSLSDILDQGAAPPGGNGIIREQMLTLQNKLGELETPARVVNVRPTPSYTLFIAKPDTVGDAGNRRQVSSNEIKRSLAHIAEEKKEWKLGFMPQLQEVAEAVGILLRTDEHKPLSLRRLLVRSAFRDHPSTLAFVAGNTLEQRLIVHDLAEIGNLLLVGPEITKQHFVNSLLLTFTSLNTPGELRIAIAGQSSEIFQSFINTPHALGRILTAASGAQRLIEGLIKELSRRKEWFAEKKVNNLDSYNALQTGSDHTRIPRIILLIDSLSDNAWQESRDVWVPQLAEILRDQGESGIHLILTAEQDHDPEVPKELEKLIPIKIIARSVAGDYPNKLDNFHGSLLRFIDAFVVEAQGGEVIPVELCSVSQLEIDKALSYWEQITEQRTEETRMTQVSGTTGVTGMLPQRQPEPPHHTNGHTSPVESEPAFANGVTHSRDDKTMIQQAQALAAYLGWISIGPLQDVMGMTVNEAKKTMLILRAMGIVEDNENPVARFLRLSALSPEEIK